MAKRSIFCRRLLSAEGWIGDAVIEMDETGLIRSFRNGQASDANVTLTGPVIPGIPNCHSHAFQRAMAGLSGLPGPDGSDSFWTWREQMYRLANRVSPEALETIARWLYIEMLEAGYTSCAEFHYLHHAPDGQPFDALDEMGERLIRAASDSGIALTLLPVLYCRAGFESSGVNREQRRFVNPPEQFHRLFELILNRVQDHPHHVVGLAFHSLRAVSGAQMLQVLEAESGRAAAIHIHVAEQRQEVEQCVSALGARPVEWLLENSPADQRWCLVHATHMQPYEYDRAAQRGLIAGLCPTTEADLGDGFFEAEYWLNRKGKLAVGSDSNLRVSACEELRLLEFGLRLRTGRRNVLARKDHPCGRLMYEETAAGGGAALGQPVGKLAVGYRADLVELDPQHPLLSGVATEDVVDRFVFAGDRSMIRSVFVGGHQRVHDGRHPAREGVAEAFSAVMEELFDE